MRGGSCWWGIKCGEIYAPQPNHSACPFSHLLRGHIKFSQLFSFFFTFFWSQIIAWIYSRSIFCLHFCIFLRFLGQIKFQLIPRPKNLKGRFSDPGSRSEESVDQPGFSSSLQIDLIFQTIKTCWLFIKISHLRGNIIPVLHIFLWVL